MHLTRAGYWFAFACVPIFQFVWMRWYIRILIWFWFMFRVSRLRLQLLAAHPDRAGGLGFLGKSSYAFTPLLFAQGALAAGQIAGRIFFEGRSLLSFRAAHCRFCHLLRSHNSGSSVRVYTTACTCQTRRSQRIWNFSVFRMSGIFDKSGCKPNLVTNSYWEPPTYSHSLISITALRLFVRCEPFPSRLRMRSGFSSSPLRL